MNNKHIQMFMQMAVVASTYSHAKRLQVGSLFVRDGRILSIGINGTIAGSDNTCETTDEFGNLVTLNTVIHSEQQAMYKACRDGESLKDSTLFVTTQPCIMCSLGLVSSGVKEVYYLHSYRCNKGLIYLQENGIVVRKIYLENQNVTRNAC